MLQGYHPTYSAEVVERLESAGAILVGKTNLDEFAMGCGTFDSAFGPSRSLWRSGIDYELTDGEGRPVAEGVDKGAIVADDDEADWVVAGGSSGGSAVSVSSGVAAASIGSDTGGSARVPGAWNGICTLKPTYGAISRRGLIPLVNSLDCPSIMASSVDDVAEIFNIVKVLCFHKSFQTVQFIIMKLLLGYGSGGFYYIK